MPTPGQELASLDFESMIGGPLIAVVNAQAQAAMSTVNFIKQVGFKPSAQLGDGQSPTAQATDEPIYVTFKYPKETQPYQPAAPAGPGGNPPATPGQPAVYQTYQLEVPILTMLPIPFLRVDLATVDFNAKINSVEYRKTDTSLKVDSSLEASAGWLFGSAKLKVSASYQRNTQQGTSVDRTYSMAVHVKAVQDEMPAGLEKLLAILEDSMKSHPAA